jgi:hypothetical protein
MKKTLLAIQNVRLGISNCFAEKKAYLPIKILEWELELFLGITVQ